MRFVPATTAVRTVSRLSFAIVAMTGAVAIALPAVGAGAVPSTVSQSVSFTANGPAMQQWTVPPGVTSVQFDVVGASSVGPGGAAAEVKGSLAVNPGSVLDLWMGLQGQAPLAATPAVGGLGGWGGRQGARKGGNGGDGLYNGGTSGWGGGGATEINLHDGVMNAGVVIVAGGGGGAGYKATSGCGSAGAGGCGALASGGGVDGSSGSGSSGSSGAGGSGGTAALGDASGVGQQGDGSQTRAAIIAGYYSGAGGGGGGNRGGLGGISGNSIGFTPLSGGGGAGGSSGPPGASYSSAAPYVGPGKISFVFDVPASATRFVPLSPSRLLDTRDLADITAGVPVAVSGGIDLQVTGRGGVPVTNVWAVVLNVTVAEATGPGFVTVWPSTQLRPIASNLNVTAAGQNIANLVTVAVGVGGKVSLYAQGGGHFVVDVEGYYEPVVNSASTAAGRFTALAPNRILDTRSSNGVPGETVIPPNSSIDVVVAGRGGVPASGVSAVVLNVTAAEATAAGFVTVWPSGQTRPKASTLNVTFAGQNIPNLVIVPLGANGKVSFYTQAGTHLLADVAGWFGDATQPSSRSGLFVPLSPGRVLDTRVPVGVPTTTPVAPNASINVTIAGSGGAPTTGMSAAVLNVTAAVATAPGFVTVWPADQPKPTASNLNVTAAGQNIPNLVEVGVSAAGVVSLYSQGGTHLLADIAGYYITG